MLSMCGMDAGDLAIDSGHRLWPSTLAIWRCGGPKRRNRSRSSVIHEPKATNPPGRTQGPQGVGFAPSRPRQNRTIARSAGHAARKRTRGTHRMGGERTSLFTLDDVGSAPGPDTAEQPESGRPMGALKIRLPSASRP
jgi:hypothetical protein